MFVLRIQKNNIPKEEQIHFVLRVDGTRKNEHVTPLRLGRKKDSRSVPETHEVFASVKLITSFMLIVLLTASPFVPSVARADEVVVEQTTEQTVEQTEVTTGEASISSNNEPVLDEP